MVDDDQWSTDNTITVLHQNIYCLKRKTHELISSISPNFLHVLCFSEHHLKDFELDQISIDGYKLAATHSRKILKGGGVCIFIQNTLECTTIKLDKYYNEKDIEVYMLKLISVSHYSLLMVVYRAPSGNFNLFLKRFGDILRSLYRVNLKFIICGDINIDYLTEDDSKRQLNAKLLTLQLSIYSALRSYKYSSY